jgi:MraZ protein
VADRELYRGFALQAVDEKGRVAIPSDLRTALDKNSPAKQVIVAKHDREPCIAVRDTEWDRERHARVDRRQEAALDDGKSVDFSAKRRMSIVETAPYDGSGRFVLPPYFRQKAKIGKWALFVGASDEFEIWAPEVLLAQPDLDEELRDLCEYLCAQRGVAL